MRSAVQQAGTAAGKIPREKGLDQSLALLREGYEFIPNRCRQFQSDIFETRLMGQKVICMSGEEAARMFYNPRLFQRKGAAPKRIQKTLFGENGIQTMDGAAHEHRKQLFMSLMTPERISMLKELAQQHFNIAGKNWEEKKEIIFFDEIQQLLCRVACEWSGVPLKEAEAGKRADDFGKLVDAFGAVGPRHWQGRLARNRAEKWIREVIEDVRSGKVNTPEGTALHAMATYRDPQGKPLGTQMAAVELINILRPIVAIATYLTFCALALYKFPESREKIQSGNEEDVHMFVQEVRRYYPFGPFLGARVRNGFQWNGVPFKKGQLVLLDVYGTNHDPRLWDNPFSFWPERFRNWEGGLFDLIPQGGGDPYKGHRCAGELVTIEVMKAGLTFLTKQLEYDVPETQNVAVSLTRMPTLPESRLIINHIKLKS
ncbi:cytochrome P450 [Siminovitchia sp. 179-K 8D1 HS]|uniref:cytochrome P450 n=1 Tax=Siminovitchia sp. 179-K 8D1 HS TaxID=3142385 RepID=UPI0039A1AD30